MLVSERLALTSVVLVEQFGFFAHGSYVFVSVQKLNLQGEYFLVELDAAEEESFVELLLVGHVAKAVNLVEILTVLVAMEVFSVEKNALFNRV